MVISMPDLADGHYHAELVVYASGAPAASEGSAGGAVVAAAATHFWVDEGGGCLTADSLPPPHPPLPPTASTPWHRTPGLKRGRALTHETLPSSLPGWETGAKVKRRGGALLNLAEGQPARLSSRDTDKEEEWGAENAVDGACFRDWVAGQEQPAPAARTAPQFFAPLTTTAGRWSDDGERGRGVGWGNERAHENRAWYYGAWLSVELKASHTPPPSHPTSPPADAPDAATGCVVA